MPPREGRGGAVRSLERVTATVIRCTRCPRLVEHRERIGRDKRRAFRDEGYWARPVPAFGDPRARMIVVGLAPAAHGANRTGRMFTGDRSGDWLYRAMHRAGFATQPRSTARGDGLRLRGAWVTAAARCAPPDNKPLPDELAACAGYLEEEIATIRACNGGGEKVIVVVALGAIAHRASLTALASVGVELPRPRPKFAHGVEHRLADDVVVVGSYHPSQQNTHTGVLTEAMLDSVFTRARQLLAP